MVDYTELKGKHKAMWALGEYDRIADGLKITTDQTLRIAQVRPGENVLDVATGTGITAIAARERGGKVTGVDLTPSLLEVARSKAEEAGWDDIDFHEGDAEDLPFAEASFDVVLSTCGHMFAPDQAKVGSELARVVRPGGRVVFLAWDPQGGLGTWFRITNQYVPPPAGVPTPFNWGTSDKVKELLGSAFRDVTFHRGDCPEFGASPEAVWDLWSTRYGPTIRALGILEGEKRESFVNDMLGFLRGYQAADGKVRWGREYVITRAMRAR